MAPQLYFKRKVTFLAGMSLILLASCSFADQPVESSDKDSQNTTETTTMNVMQKMNRKEQISFSKQDLAARLDLELDAVTLSGATPVTWRSSALGCPKPDTQYMQSLVPGVLIMLRVDNTAYRYHAAPGLEPFFCPKNMVEPQYTNSSDA